MNLVHLIVCIACHYNIGYCITQWCLFDYIGRRRHIIYKPSSTRTRTPAQRSPTHAGPAGWHRLSATGSSSKLGSASSGKMCAHTVPECKWVYTGILLDPTMFQDKLQHGFTDHSLYEYAECRSTRTHPSVIGAVYKRRRYLSVSIYLSIRT